MSRLRITPLLACVLLAACDSDSMVAPLSPDCQFDRLTDPGTAATCLHRQGAISLADRDQALALFAVAPTVRDSLLATGLVRDLNRGFELVRALAQIGDYYSRRLFPDSVRFHRMLDRVAVTIADGRGQVPYRGGTAVPPGAPYQMWHRYDGLGLFFQPVETAQLAVSTLPQESFPTDSLLQIAEHLYDYALWRQYRGMRYPVWEYEFDWTSGGVSVRGPWISGMAQGLAMIVFTACYVRTNDALWRTRAMETLNALRVPWDQGGVVLPDTTHGYWWEGYHPVVQPWNEAAQALVAVAYLYNVTLDPAVLDLYTKGATALKYFTPFFDTGTWTLYSRTQGYNGTFYHGLCIERLDALYALTGDEWYKTVADRWRTYTPPPGIQ